MCHSDFNRKLEEFVMKELSQTAQAVRASTTLAIDALFKQMKADGIDVIGFGAAALAFPASCDTRW